MDNDFINQSNKFASTALDSFKEVAQINSKLLERATQHQLELVNASVEVGFRGTRLLQDPEGMKELVAEYSERVLTTLRRSLDVLAEAQDGLEAIQKRSRQAAGRTAERTSRGSKAHR